MRMSLLTNSLTGIGISDLKTIADWAAENGICELDVGPAVPLDKKQYGAVLDEGKVAIKTLIYCRNFLSENEEEAKMHCDALRERIQFAGEMGIEKIVCSTGVTAQSFEGMGFTPEKSLPAVVELAKQFVDLAEKNGVRLCYENCPMMGNIATSPDMWEAIFDAVGSERLGLCYDPSHLVWQFIDPYRNIYKFADKIFHVHAKDKPLGEDVDLKQIAQTTAGFTGADLENLMNEAAIAAARKGHVFIRQKDIKNAFIKVGIGAEKKSKVISEKEKRITAYHEAGHAILFHVLPDMEPVYTISIIPTGMGAAGYTMPLPENDEIFNTKGKMLQDITTLLGGRVAEELIFGDITTGASNDIKRATSEARAMVTKYGMSDKIGLISYGDDDDEVFIGRDLAHTRGYSEDVAKAIDSEIHSIIEECHDNAKKIISEHMEVLHGCAKLLLEKEKVHRDEFEALFTMEKSGESNESI